MCVDFIFECLDMKWRLHLQHVGRAERLSELLMIQFPVKHSHESEDEVFAKALLWLI